MVQPSRRSLLRLGVVAVGSAGPLAFAERALAAITPKGLVRKTFTPLVGSTFRFTSRGLRYTGVLTSVDNLPHSVAGDQHQFRLLFSVRGRGPSQGTYRFSSSALAPFQLFVVPVGGGRQYYEAVVVSAR